jgi:hypothetical protein
VHEALALDARQESECVVEPTCFLELFRRVLLEGDPVALVMEGARYLEFRPLLVSQ